MQATPQERCVHLRIRDTMYRLLKGCYGFRFYVYLRIIREGDSITNQPTFRDIILHVCNVLHLPKAFDWACSIV